jgi:hypothetical protein
MEKEEEDFRAVQVGVVDNIRQAHDLKPQSDSYAELGTFFTFALSWKMIRLFLFKPPSPLY